MFRFRSFARATGATLLAAGVANAATVSLTLQNGNGGGGEFNTTAFAVQNDAGPGVLLTQMTFTVGDTQYLFDQLYLGEEQFVGGNGTQAAELLVGDRTDDNAGPDLFTYGFSNFGSGVAFRGQWDIDNDNGDFNADMRNVFFNNGAAPNAVATFLFSDGSGIVYEFPDLPVQSSYTLVIPEPGSLVGLAVVALAACSRRR